MSFLGMLDRLTMRNITKFGSNSDQDFSNREKSHEADFPEANVVTSRIKQPSYYTFNPPLDHHLVLLDIDHEAYLIPSSTPGNSHLYINKELTKEQYFKLLDVLAECGIIELGYAEASKKKGYTALRLPWVKKGDKSVVSQSATFNKHGYDPTPSVEPDTLIRRDPWSGKPDSAVVF